MDYQIIRLQIADYENSICLPPVIFHSVFQ
jgi:hypothetical protein